MKNKILWLLLWLIVPLSASADQDVTFTASNPDFAVVSTAMGKVRASGPFITVHLTRYTMRTNTNMKVPVKVRRYKIGLAYQKATSGEWDVARWSEPINQNIVLSPGETKLFENITATIPVDNLPSLNKYWLVLTVETDFNGQVGYTYAHSNKGLF